MNESNSLKNTYKDKESFLSDADKIIRSKLSIPPQKRNIIEKTLFKPKQLYNHPNNLISKNRLKAIKFAVDHHYKNCRYYHNYCKKMDFSPIDISSESDLFKVPLISALNFKAYESEEKIIQWLNKIFVGDMPKIDIDKKNICFDKVIKMLYEKGVITTYSSGTTGRFSFVPRDSISWQRQQYSYSRAIELMPFISKPYSYTGILFMPNPRKTFLFLGRIALTALEILDMVDQSKIHFAIDREVSTDLIKIIMGRDNNLKNKILGTIITIAQSNVLNKYIKILEKCDETNENILFGGQPFLLNLLMSRLEKKGISYDFSDSIVLTTGGWKGHNNVKLSEKDFRRKVEKILGVPDQRCRDLYGMVESSTLNVSCQGHYKHIPHSVVFPMVLNQDYEPVGYDKYGRFAFLDPLANSYPGFILTNDRVKILEKCPVCDRTGPVIVEDVSRLSDSEIVGCGAIMTRMISKEITKK